MDQQPKGGGSLKRRIFDELLPRVQKPARYIGNEVNMIRKDPAGVDLRVVLFFPDVYEIGMSYMGFPILYHLLNQRPEVYAERAFIPWTDMAGQMRQRRIPLFSLETFTPLADFDLIGITLQHELNYTNVVEALDLAGLPLYAEERSSGPFIIGGGPSAFNPEPVADFFDLILIGDGEQAIFELAAAIVDGKRRQLSRYEILLACSRIRGVYVPRFYRCDYDDSGDFKRLQVIEKAAPGTIRARITEELTPLHYPKKPLVPVMATTHDRVALEIARGCSRGCRFCNAGMIYRPVRERPAADLVQQALDNIDSTGYDEVSLVSLSTSDYTAISPLLAGLHRALAPRMVNLSFPSLRPEKFTEELAHYGGRVRKSGLTLAPEAGSQRLREVINKHTSAAELLRAVELAFRQGWRLIKLYFMIGQPTETDEDLAALADLVGEVAATAKKYSGARVNVAVSPFVPKAVTPFQWAAQDDVSEIERKVAFLRNRIRQKSVNLSWRDAQRSVVEGVLARGDRRLSRVIERAWRLGSCLEGWDEFFYYDNWMRALQESDLDAGRFTRSRSVRSPLPWDHIDKGVTKKFLRDEYDRALGVQILPDCRDGQCNRCGLMGQLACQAILHPQPATESVAEPARVPDLVPPSRSGFAQVVRMKFSRTEEVRFISHLDFVQLFVRAMRRAAWPLQYSEGFNPHARLAFGPPLSSGMTSDDEYLDVFLHAKWQEEWLHSLQSQLPPGILLEKARATDRKPRALLDVINRIDYQVRWPEPPPAADLAARTTALMQQTEIPFTRRKPGGPTRTFDLRSFIVRMEAAESALEIALRTVDGSTARIDEIMHCLYPHEPERTLLARAHRRRSWAEQETELVSPLDLLPAIEKTITTEET